MTGVRDVPDHRYGGATALVELHEKHLRSFLDVWREARERGVALPATEDGDCAALDALLHHVLSCARGYLTWCCEVLALDDPGIPPYPDGAAPDEVLADWTETLLDRWRDSPLREVEEERFYRPTHRSRWKVRYCVDAMLEHAVMHPIRHERQLRRILSAAPSAGA